MLTKKITLTNKLGLHARAAAKFVKLAGTFGSDVKLLNKHQPANGKSILAVMMLAANQGTELELVIDGEDESEALVALEKLIEGKFGESE